MSEETESLSEDQIGALVRRLLGPEDEWDDAAAEFVLSVYGIDPGSSASYLRDLIFRDIDARRQRNETRPPIVFRILTSLIEKEETDTEATEADRVCVPQTPPSARSFVPRLGDHRDSNHWCLCMRFARVRRRTPP